MKQLATLLGVLLAVIGASYAVPIAQDSNEVALEQYFSTVWQQDLDKVFEGQMQNWFNDTLSGAIRAAIRAGGEYICRQINNPQSAERATMQIIENKLEMMQDDDDDDDVKAQIIGGLLGPRLRFGRSTEDDTAKVEFLRRLGRRIGRRIGDWWKDSKDKVLPTLTDFARKACNSFLQTTEAPTTTVSQEEVLLQNLLLKATQQAANGDMNPFGGKFDINKILSSLPTFGQTPQGTSEEETDEVQMQRWFKNAFGRLIKYAGNRLCNGKPRSIMAEEQAGDMDEAVMQYFDNKVEVMQYEGVDEAETQFFKRLGRWFRRNKRKLRPIVRNVGRQLCNTYFPGNTDATEEAVDSKMVQKFFQSLLAASQTK